MPPTIPFKHFYHQLLFIGDGKFLKSKHVTFRGFPGNTSHVIISTHWFNNCFLNRCSFGHFFIADFKNNKVDIVGNFSGVFN